MQMIIFDVDNTLVQSSELENHCYRQAVIETLGDVAIRPEWHDYPDVTDAGILRDICHDNDLDPSQERGTSQRFADLVEEYLTENPCSCPEVPGAKDMLERLLQDTGAKVGIATGGWLKSAQHKLLNIGLDPAGLAIASSNHGTSRCEIMTACRSMLGHSVHAPIYVGDGHWDARACALLDWKFVAVGPRLAGQSLYWCQDFIGSEFEVALEQLREPRMEAAR